MTDFGSGTDSGNNEDKLAEIGQELPFDGVLQF